MKTTEKPLRQRLHEIIFEADSKSGKFFDVLLLWAIAISVIVVMLDSVIELHEKYKTAFFIAEWFFTILFTIEYIFRIILVKRPLKYIVSFYGIIDLLSILPSFVGLWLIDSHSLRVIRILRLLRIFRILKLFSFLKEAAVVRRALVASRQKIIVFLFAVMAIVTVLGTLMYMIESPDDGFTSIPRSIYWAIVTLTTVGYGDITPHTATGQALASIVMILGYAIIAVPTGIVTSELNKVEKEEVISNTQVCEFCAAEGHTDKAKHCDQCGTKLHV
ncbi:MAG: voltage-gated potassium channel [Patiriisocius sp.]|jgi:voltage-gated potassium channel